MSGDRDELTELRQRVDCRTVLERAGWELDARESSRLATKYRQGAGRIVIVTHEGKGWFDPLGDKRGDVIALAQHVWGGSLGHARKALRPLAGISPQLMPAVQGGVRTQIDAQAEWNQAKQIVPGSQAWSYLTKQRCLSTRTIERVAQAGALREGVCGTMWAQHQNTTGHVTGWEMRGPHYKGFSKGGMKTLFTTKRLATIERVIVTESAIDAMSLATLEGWRDGTVYASTGGGYGPETEAALCGLLSPGVGLVAATDLGTGGEPAGATIKGVGSGYGLAMHSACPKSKGLERATRQHWDQGGGLPWT